MTSNPGVACLASFTGTLSREPGNEATVSLGSRLSGLGTTHTGTVLFAQMQLRLYLWCDRTSLIFCPCVGEPENGAYLIPRLPKPGSGNGIWEATLTSVLWRLHKCVKSETDCLLLPQCLVCWCPLQGWMLWVYTSFYNLHHSPASVHYWDCRVPRHSLSCSCRAVDSDKQLTWCHNHSLSPSLKYHCVYNQTVLHKPEQ